MSPVSFETYSGAQPAAWQNLMHVARSTWNGLRGIHALSHTFEACGVCSSRIGDQILALVLPSTVDQFSQENRHVIRQRHFPDAVLLALQKRELLLIKINMGNIKQTGLKLHIRYLQPAYYSEIISKADDQYLSLWI